MLVFLDLDGVLRREGSAPFKLETHLLRRFETMMRLLPGAEIVIASAWRAGFPLAEIRAHFAGDIRSRIVGSTPLLLAEVNHRRHREVLGYLSKHAPGGPAWAAVDDQQENYPTRENILIVNPRTGFDDAAAAWLLMMGHRYGADRPSTQEVE